MEAFAKESFKLGTLSGFRHFHAELRGREELLITVWPSREAEWPGGGSPLVPMRGGNRTLPPASPCDRERAAKRWGEEARATAVFLIGGYAHYNCPYVWVREGHALLGSSFHGDSMDSPATLESTMAWRERTVHVWEIVAELVTSTSAPPPANPFDLVDEPLQGLPLMDAVLASAALAAFLREVYLSSSPFAPLVEPQMLSMLRLHFSRLPLLSSSSSATANGTGYHGAAAGSPSPAGAHAYARPPHAAGAAASAQTPPLPVRNASRPPFGAPRGSPAPDNNSPATPHVARPIGRPPTGPSPMGHPYPYTPQ